MMRFLICAAGVAVLAGSAFGQHSFVPPTIGPSFTEAAVNADKFDAVFNVQVTTVPAVPLLRGQPSGARFDAVVCNAGKDVPGWVKVDPNARWGVLEPGQCTMFSNFGDLQLTTSGSNLEWDAKVFLRAHR